MPITRRDNAVVVVLVLSLVVLGGVIAMPAPAHDAAATPEPTPEVTLPPPVTYREGVVGVPATIMPVAARTRSERTLVGLIFSGLVRLGPDNTYEPDLAESWTTDAKGKKWTFKIRDDATWQDGEPVTAQDVVFTVEALKDPAASGAMAGAWADVTATAIDPKTVELTVATPIAGFLAATTQPLLPAHLLSDVPLADLAKSPFAKAPVGTGPYSLTELDDTHALLTPVALMERPGGDVPLGPTPPVDSLGTPAPTQTPQLAVPYLERIELDFFEDDAAAAEAFSSGAVDGVAGLPPAISAALASDPAVTSVAVPDDDARDGPAQPAREPSRAARRAGPQGAARRHRPAGDRATARSAARAPRRHAGPTDVVGVRRQGRRAGRVRRQGGDQAAQRRPAGRRRTASGPRRTARPRTRSQLLTVPASANPRLAAVAAAIAKAWTDFGIQRGRSWRSRRPTLATKLRGGDVHGGRRWTSRWASSRTSTRCSRRARCGARGRT